MSDQPTETARGDWHIDAWDARGGRAFASLRVADTDLVGNTDRPILFVGPPGFRPEVVTNPSIALTAARGRFAPRVPSGDGAEVAFPDPEAVAEFVRRAFISSGSDRGGSPGGGDVGPLPEEGDGGNGNYKERNGVVDFLEELRSLRGFLDGLPGLTCVETSLSGEGVVPSAADEAIARGALRIAATLLAHAPMNLRDPNKRMWLEANQSLAVALDHLSLWQDLHESIDNTPKTPAAHLFAAAYKFRRERVRTYEELWNPIVVGLYPLRDGYRWAHPGLVDRYASLFSWPLPQPDRTQSGAVSVGQLLVRFVASPTETEWHSMHMLDVVQFAAAYLGCNVNRKKVGDWRAHAASQWLAGSLPRLLFSRQVEMIIAEVGR